ncbi:MAG TPA: 2-oxoacid:acceptor oxidoreductase family protein [Candidatus Acidoferrales bacterium]|nr:2-oxoacid:acceptor oxidoreductase family protein [Candidatus Acidoferrales bacterium]
MSEETIVAVGEIEAEKNDFEVLHSKSPVFYPVYERKSDLKHQTHYCPGCGHGIVHKLVAEAVQDLSLQDRTILVSPVGCAVFAYYYLDVGNVQVAHGRAPAAATGLARACPGQVVISYQGDGDLAAIGTAEIVHAANRGEKICVIFVNNAIYGMTGGQMAPTTLVGQTSTTSPWGRRPANEGYPIHMCELLATLEAPVYIERVALCDNKNIMKARRAIRKALEIQRDGGGFAFVEVLSPCPTIWGLDPVVARNWVAEKMVPVFPLNVFRDRKPEPLPNGGPKQRSVAKVLELAAADDDEASPVNHPSHSFQTLTVKVAGSGGQGALLLGQLLAEMGLREGLEVSWLPSYGPEMRSGSAHCHVCVSKERIGSPLISHPDVLIAMNEISLRKFAPQVGPHGLILYNREKLPENFVAPEARVVCVPASEIADKLGSTKAANMVLLGALLEETGCLGADTALRVIEQKVKKVELLKTNREALEAGRQFVDTEVWTGAESQPDGFAE